MSWYDEPFGGYAFAWLKHEGRGFDCESSYGYCYALSYAEEDCNGLPMARSEQLNRLVQMESCSPVSVDGSKAKSIKLACRDHPWTHDDEP